MVGIAVANGGFREAWLVPRLGEHQGRQVSTLLLVALNDLASGRLWALVPLWIAVAPYVLYRWYRRKAGVR